MPRVSRDFVARCDLVVGVVLPAPAVRLDFLLLIRFVTPLEGLKSLSESFSSPGLHCCPMLETGDLEGVLRFDETMGEFDLLLDEEGPPLFRSSAYSE